MTHRRAAFLAILWLAACGPTNVNLDEQGDGTDAGGDGGASDADTESGTGFLDHWVGTPCDTDDDTYCLAVSGHADAYCLPILGTDGICTMNCTEASHANMDSCDMDGIVCMDIADHIDGGGRVCVEMCVPEPDGNPCRAPYVTCSPASWSMTAFHSTCILPSCQNEGDCPVGDRPCETDDDCDTANGEECQGEVCTLFGDCSEVTGRCTWEGGDPEAEIGDPCEQHADCGDNMQCYAEGHDHHGNPPHGFCTRIGCNAARTDNINGSGSADNEDEFGCGPHGVCNTALDLGGTCLRRCDVHDHDGELSCRLPAWESGPVGDARGDYECYDMEGFGWNILVGEGDFYLVSAAPFCIWREGWPGDCGGVYADSSADCHTYFGGANSADPAVGMICRNPETGEEDEENGWCLDVTTSGPTGTWDIDCTPDVTAVCDDPFSTCTAGCSGEPDEQACVDACFEDYCTCLDNLGCDITEFDCPPA